MYDTLFLPYKFNISHHFMHHRTGKCFDIDIYGQGPHTDAIQAHAEKNDLPVRTTQPH